MGKADLLFLTTVIVACLAAFSFATGSEHSGRRVDYHADRGHMTQLEPEKLQVTNGTFNGKVYSIVHRGVTWLDAVSTCNKLGANLTDVVTLEEFRFLIKLCRKVPNKLSVWTGGAALGTAEMYVWVPSGIRVREDIFMRTEESDPNHGYCVRLHWNDKNPRLTTWDCGHTRLPVCKYL